MSTLHIHYALCIILNIKTLSWIPCPSFWQSKKKNLRKNRPCQCAQKLISPHKQQFLTGCRGVEPEQRLLVSPTLLRRSSRLALIEKEVEAQPARETSLILLHSHYRGRTHRDKVRITDALAPQGTSHFSYFISDGLWRYTLYRFVPFSSRPPQDSV